MANHKTSPKFSTEVRERAVRMVFEHRTEHTSQWAAIASIAAKIGCTAQTLSNWVRRAERDQGKRPDTTTDERERIKVLERENRELRQANEILRKASAYFAQAELDRFVDAYRDDHGVEPICKVIEIAPSTYHAPTSPAAPSRRRHRRVSSATPCSASRSEGFSMRTSRSTACARSGGSCCGKGATWPAARWRA